VRLGDHVVFARTDGRAGVVIPLISDIDPFVQRPSGVGFLADSAAGQWRQVQAPTAWTSAQWRQSTDYVDPTPCWVGWVWHVRFKAVGQGRWLLLTSGDRRLYLGSDGGITYFDPSNPRGYVLTE